MVASMVLVGDVLLGIIMQKPVLTKQEIATKYAGRAVRVYFNLHTKKWSVQDYKSRIVLFHCDHIELENVTGRVSEAGRYDS